MHKQERIEKEDKPKEKHSLALSVFASVATNIATLAFLGTSLFVVLAVRHPDSPLPDEWNPRVPLDVAADLTPLTLWKLNRALGSPDLCRAVLEAASDMTVVDPIEENANCHVRNRVNVSSVGSARVNPVDTACGTALRLAMWEQHGIQPAAREILGTDVATIRQVGSYNCRPIRTSQGPSNRWSTHATADAIDIVGFDLRDGRSLRLIDDWGDQTAEARFLKETRDSACTWFATTLGPDFNALHADHFHLQNKGRGTCR